LRGFESKYWGWWYVTIGVGFLLLFLDTGRAIIAKYGSLGRALGWPQAFGNTTEAAPPPTIVASTVVTIINIPAIAVGAVILTVSLVNAYAVFLKFAKLWELQQRPSTDHISHPKPPCSRST